MAGEMIPPAVIDILGRDQDLLTAIARDKSALADLAKTATDPRIGADSRDFQTTLTKVKTELLDVAKSVTRAKLGADSAPFWAEIAALRAAVDAMSPLDINVDANVATALAQIDAMRGGLASAQTGGLLASALAGAAAGDKGGGGGGKGGLMAALGFGGLFGLAGFGTLGSLAGFGPESMLTTGLGIAGSAAGGLLGGGALALGSAGVAGVGMGTDLAGIGQAANDAKSYTQALNQLNQAIAVNGPLSQQAQQAQAQLNYTLSQMPTAAQAAVVALSATAQQFRTQFDQATGVAEAKGAAILQQLVQVGEKFLPTIGQFASQNMTIIQASLQPLLTWIQGPGLAVFSQLEQTFQNQLPTAMNAFDQGVELLIRTLGFLAPYTGRLIDDLSKWLTALNGADFGKFTGAINTAIGIFRDWEGLIKAVGTAIYELFSHDAGTGTALVTTLTNMVNHFNDWAKTVAGGDQLHSLLEAHKQELLAIIGVFGQIISAWGQLELTARPIIMDLVGGLASIVGFLSKIPGVGQIMGFVLAFEILGSRIGPLNGLLTSFNNLIRDAVFAALRGLGGMLIGLGGPFTSVGTWLTGLGTEGTSEVAALTGAVERLNTTLAQTAVAGQGALAGVGRGAAAGEAGLLGANGAPIASEAAGAGTAAEGAGAAGVAGLSAMLGPIALVGAGFAGLALGANALGHAMGVGLNGGAQNVQKLATSLQALPSGSLDQANSSLSTLTQKLMQAAPPGQTLAQVLHQAGTMANEAGTFGFTSFSSSVTGMVTKYNSLSQAVALGNSNLQMLSNVTGLAAPIVNNLANALGINLTQALTPTAVETMTNYIKQQGGVAAVTGQQWQASAEAIQAAMELMAAKAHQAMPQIPQAAANMVAQTQPHLVSLEGDLRKTGDGSGADFVAAFLAHLGPAELASKRIHDGTKSPLDPLVQELDAIGDTSAANMIAKFIGHQGAAKSGAQGMHDAIANPLKVLEGQLSTTGDAAGAGLIADFAKHHPEALTQSGLMHDAVTGKLNPLVSDLKTISDTAGANAVQGLINHLGDASSASAQLGAALAGGINAAMGAAASTVAANVANITRSLMGMSSPVSVHTPGHAAGGIFSTPHLAWIAEAGEREMVLPESKVPGGFEGSGLAALLSGGPLPSSGGGGRGGGSGAAAPLTVAPVFNVTINAQGGNPHQIGNAFRKAAEEHTDEILRRLRAGTISSYGG